ncbi:hypothetical protein AGABI2DRAFT_216285 [Agaricus bisporus var. bisporus H97]|uniref:hypothetical protein n=1 Tax=Agaricus bisporus var. bisporus (strain H97 / ATCC MYA-4626 / FGSC 10389) TaxID=936046 RepID=UPI00029F7DF1|nr:hypothetical protein AGABI2DRAFT_216285 [Agaricus bisporus var. bisporus H97]EKV50040.1 hypothetical protein AGABI2DRAFT_216285 [Agaricus bisporus var. bisporus H97]
MDIDETESVATERSVAKAYGEPIYAKSDEMTVSFYASLPVEVKQVLRNADFFKDAYTGSVDTVAGFALVASAQTCFVWQHVQAIRGTPTCYIFSCPQDHTGASPPLHAFIPHAPLREPGLILVSHSGQVRLWENISTGLAGGENYSTMELDVKEDEYVTNFIRVDAQTFLASTSSGHLFRLGLTPTGGKYRLVSHLFARPTTSLNLSRFFPSLFGASELRPADAMNAYVSSITLGKLSTTGEREVWVLVNERIQKWELKPEGWEELLLDRNVVGLLKTAVKDKFRISEEDDQSMDFELIDLAFESEDKLVVLVSYAHAEESSLMSTDISGMRRVFAVVRLSVYGDTFKIESTKSVPYQTTATSGAPAHPRIYFLANGAVAVVQFGDAVTFIARDSNYRDRLELKSVTDRTLGVGVYESDRTLLMLTASTMMRVRVDVEKIEAFDYEIGFTNLIKSIMMQAILYGSLPENPLHFSFPPEIDAERLMQGAEQLSDAVLRSDPDVVRKNHDLTSQLISRKERLSWLIQFINDNAVLGKMSQRSRQQLATDAEKLYAAHQLWVQYNDLLATNPQFSVLNDAVHDYMTEVGESAHEDVLRAFFRLRVSDIGRLIKKVKDAATAAARNTGRNIAEFLPEANRIVISVLRSAFDYRDYNLGVYGIEPPMLRPWTSRPSVIDVVLALFDASTKVLENQTTSGGNQSGLGELNSQLADLAEFLLACIQERLNWLARRVASDEPSAKRDKEELEQRFALLRPEVLETLRRCGHENAAFALGEQYRDFSSLVALCHREVVYPPEKNPNAARIQSYIDRFKEDFTRELYQWYIQHGELRVMFSEDDERGYMDKFFVEQPNDSISWLHDIGKKRFDAASDALLREARGAVNLESKHLLLSIGKLAHLAQVYDNAVSMNEKTLDWYHDELDFVSVHEALLEDMQTALVGMRGRHSLDNQIDTIVKAKAIGLAEKKGMLHIFKDLVKHLLQGKALSIEDAADMLTLKDNEETIEDFATALQLVSRATNLPEARKKSALRTVWRRVYLHDDWNAIRKTVNVSDAELSERFKRTALYSVLSIQLPRNKADEELEIKPDEALGIPTQEEVASRWPGMSPEQSEAVINDYINEMDALGELELDEELFIRVRELAGQDAVWDEE